VTETPIDVAPVSVRFAALREAVGSIVVGQELVLRQLFVTLLCSSHALVEGVPGVAKTLLVKTLAATLGIRFGRVQFTPDLMPSDVIGTTILEPGDGSVRFRPGPLFTDLLLADEINRASAKTQAALLEAMQERAATVDGVRHELGPWFSVFATQNPVEHEGTYPLPEAELDRFLFKIVIDYPSETEEHDILGRHHAGGREPGSLGVVLDPESLESARRIVERIIVRGDLIAYVASLVRATRGSVDYALGASPRAGVMLLRAAKANAALEGRDYVLPEDVQEMFQPALRHRVKLDPAAEVEGLTADAALARTLRGVAVPR
jgi:MoxR-like ATPase